MSRRRESKGKARKGGEGAVGESFKDVVIDPEVVSSIESDVARMKYVTPFILSRRHELTISAARRVLKLLESKGVVELYSKSRRSPLYVPSQKQAGKRRVS